MLAPASRHDSTLLAPAPDKLDGIGPLPAGITVHLDAGYDSHKTRGDLAGRGMTGQIAASRRQGLRSRPGSGGISSGQTPVAIPSTPPALV